MGCGWNPAPDACGGGRLPEEEEGMGRAPERAGKDMAA